MYTCVFVYVQTCTCIFIYKYTREHSYVQCIHICLKGYLVHVSRIHVSQAVIFEFIYKYMYICMYMCDYIYAYMYEYI